jgi:hypothetical protein
MSLARDAYKAEEAIAAARLEETRTFDGKAAPAGIVSARGSSSLRRTAARSGDAESH